MSVTVFMGEEGPFVFMAEEMPFAVADEATTAMVHG
jgi:hypothetical protein